MKLNYYSDTDSLYIELKPIPSADSKEVASGLVLDFDGNGNIVGIDIQNASKKLDLTTLETHSLPTKKTQRA
jgi:uncharacterized protein YuzE